MLALPEKGKGEKKMLVENPVKITETQIKKMAKLARGRTVLDCFTHTGSFALNAGIAGLSLYVFRRSFSD